MAAEGNLAEIAAAQGALEKSGSSDIKSFAQMMIDDHGKANDALKAIAAADTPPTQPTATDRKMIAKLMDLRGDRFDKAYVKGQRSAHRQAVALFTREAKSGHAEQLRMFAQNTLPSLKKHLAMADDLANATKAPN
jgi:putative membrane protein